MTTASGPRPDALAPETLMMGLGYDPHLSEGAIKPPIFQTSTFVFRSAEDGKRFFEVAYGLRKREAGEALGLIYSRINNPNLEILEDRLAVWDHADKALVFSSGMAAISTSMLALCRPGDEVLYTAPAYGGTEYLFDRILPRFNVGVSSCPIEHGSRALLDRVSAAIAASRTTGRRLAAVYVETPANPTNQMVDLAALAALLREQPAETRPLLVVDNTFLGPVWQQPLTLGAEDLMARVAEMRTIGGTCSDPHTSWLLLRSLETLKIRMEKSQANAMELVDRLAAHPKVVAVLTAGGVGASPEQVEIASRQCQGQGSTFSIRLGGGEAEAFRFLNALKIFKLAVSLGGTESLASHPSSTTHSDYTPEAKRACGVGDDLVRLSVGIENVEDLWRDLDAALEMV